MEFGFRYDRYIQAHKRMRHINKIGGVANIAIVRRHRKIFYICYGTLPQRN